MNFLDWQWWFPRSLKPPLLYMALCQAPSCFWSYHIEITSSRLTTEVKQCWGRLVLGWVTLLEHEVLQSYFCFLSLFFCVFSYFSCRASCKCSWHLLVFTNPFALPRVHLHLVLRKLKTWFSVNQLTVNLDKTNFSVYSYKDTRSLNKLVVDDM